MAIPEIEPLKCLIVDDEALAHEVIKNHLEQLDKAKLVGQCYNGAEAFNFLLKHDVDVLFLDINMPELSGLDLLKSLNKRPKVILTTAYSEYALAGYELDVVDYLLKPIGFVRFLKAFNKLLDLQAKSVARGIKSTFIDVKVQGLPFRLPFSDLEYVEGLGNYAKFYLLDRMVMIQETMHALEEKSLPKDVFCRVHKSFIANISMIESVADHVITFKSGRTVPLGRNYKALFRDRWRLFSENS